MKTEDLIVALAREAAPVRTLPTLGARLGRWMALSLVVAVVAVWWFGARGDLPSRFADWRYLASLGAVATLAVSSAVAALSLSVPNESRSRAIRVLPVVAAASWGILLLGQLTAGGSIVRRVLTEPAHAACVAQIALVAVFPALALVRGVARGAPLEPVWSGCMAFAAALGTGAVTAALMCPIDRPAHQAVWHFLPVVSLAVCGAFVGARWLDRLQPARPTSRR